MVFQKLTDTDKEQLAIFGQEHDKKQVSAMRALIMRGATPNEARTMAIERENARNELVEAMAKEMQQKEEEEAKVVPETKVKAKRAPRKAKAVPGAETDVEAEPEPTAPPPSPKLKRTRSKKVKESAEQLVNETPDQITILA